MDIPWRTMKAAEAGREYIALLSYLPLKSHWRIPKFLRYSLQVQEQMRNSPGAIGFALRAKMLSRDFWTLSVWEGGKALMDFVNKAPHAVAMKAIAPHMGATRFTQWKLAGSAVPPNWDEALKREAQEK